MVGGTVLYYTSAGGHSLVPMVLAGIPTILVAGVALKAIYEISKHRDD
jgi:hypothetical protein